jgi:tetratricopeptide (TPR) repeat protein
MHDPVRTPRALRTAACLFALAALAAPLQAADTPEPPPPPPPRAAAPAADPLGAAREHIAARRWPQAIAALQRANLADSADWNNLMGYALRKQAVPDLDGAQRHYDAALRLNPVHRGALEYAGELALMKNDLPRAQALRARLAAACGGPCEELDDLDRAIAQFGPARR